jgi:hydrogenase expression/formation protein HypC
MCLALPARVETIDEAADTAIVALGGVRKEVSLTLVEDVQVGDFLLIHVGYALSKISPEEADRTLQLFAEAGLTDERSPSPRHLETG